MQVTYTLKLMPFVAVPGFPAERGTACLPGHRQAAPSVGGGKTDGWKEPITVTWTYN